MPDYDPDAELSGLYVVAFLESAGDVSPVFERKVRSIFETHIDDIDPGRWYRVGDVETAFDEVLDEIGAKTMEQGGVNAAYKNEYPEPVDSVREAVDLLNDIHNDAHRGSTLRNPAGRYVVDWRDDSTFRGAITTGYPYGYPVIPGVYKGTVQRFAGRTPTVEAADPDSGEAGAWVFDW